MKKDTILRNEQIKAKRVVLIDDEGAMVGEFLITDAISMAKDRGYDLIQVSGSSSDLPTCKMMDYGKYQYDKKKKQKKGGTSAQVKIKEIKFSINTDEHDMAVRYGNAKRFLDKGHKLRVTVQMRGRETTHYDIAANKCLSFVEGLGDAVEMEQEPKLRGKYHMTMLLKKRSV